ncbi:response regulator [Candidatus Albibeggiatoa sp. nov. NOAA]|uniref:response regulator n=1 Tax=Candidatus Albibeggiatoa sp. nov. NOAA TaxID=3162724 RepID=UPI0032F30A69|nr:response regulator [Thiotrichaceae bacterium]
MPDLILMDIHMPVMDGWEAIQIIRATESIKHIPIICLTAHFLQGFKEKIFAAGFDDILVKPIIPKELFKKINVLLSNS